MLVLGVLLYINWMYAVVKEQCLRWNVWLMWWEEHLQKMSKHFICIFLFINYPLCMCAIRSTLHKCVQCVLVEVAANSLTSFSSHELVPCGSLQASTLRAAKYLQYHITSPPNCEDASIPPSIHAKVLSESRPSCHFLSAATSNKGNCSEMQRLPQT